MEWIIFLLFGIVLLLARISDQIRKTNQLLEWQKRWTESAAEIRHLNELLKSKSPKGLADAVNFDGGKL